MLVLLEESMRTRKGPKKFTSNNSDVVYCRGTELRGGHFCGGVNVGWC